MIRRNGRFELERHAADGVVRGYVWCDGERVGHYWTDPHTGRLAVFRVDSAEPVGRRLTERAAILLMTGRQWDGGGAL